MIVKCEFCPKYYDDTFRSTLCPHDTFNANDGQNNFKHYPESWLADYEPRHDVGSFIKIDNSHITLSEYDIYQRFLDANKIKI